MSRFVNPVAQYLYDDGDPVAKGKLYFYVSGTNTQIVTYADINLSVANPNPVILSASGRVPNIFFDGTANCIFTDADDVQIWARDPIGDTGITGSFSAWNSLTVFGIGVIVTGSNGLYYVSITDANQGNDPTTDAVNWTQVKFNRVWNVNETHIIGNIVQGTDLLLYVCTVGNTGLDPVTNTTSWKPATTIDVPAGVLAISKINMYNQL